MSSMNTIIGPILLSALNGGIINAAAGESPGELPYMYFIADSNIFSKEDTLGVCAVELPFVAAAHLISRPKNQREAGYLPLDLTKLDTVLLEGNYSHYFDLYTTPNEQSNARYVLDPAAMVFTIDFCSKFYWEIYEDTLYFMSEGAIPSLKIVDEFVRQIRPAIESPSNRLTNAAKLPYTFTHGRKLLCPRCNKKLVIGREWMECPDGHGFLITGAQMLSERESEEVINYNPARVAEAMVSEPIPCPYCKNEMKQTFYQNSEIEIDVCSKCPHRWIDGHEIHAVIGN